jgi:AbrB family looped-hinge helix DNA binding protein
MHWSKDGTADDRRGWQPFSMAEPPGKGSVVSRQREIEGRCARETSDASCAKSDHPAFEHIRLTVEVLTTERGAVCERQASPHTLYLSGMTGRIGAKGQVVIPKALRDQALLQPGDVVDFKLRDKEIVLVARRSPARLGGRFSKTGMAARLLEDRMIEPR